MKNLRILIASICLLYVASLAFTSATFAEDSEGQVHTTVTQGASIKHTNSHKRSEKKTPKKLQKLHAKKAVQTKKLHATLKTAHTIVHSHKGSTPAGTTTPVTPPSSTSVTSTTTSNTRTATVSYNTPEGSVPVRFSVTVQGGVITAASSTSEANGASAWYQDNFSKSITSAVVGKSVSGLSLSAIGGASLTTAAFQQFVASAS